MPLAINGHGHGRDVLHAGEVIGRAVGRAVVDDDELPVRPGLAKECGEALPGELELIPAGDNDGCQATDGVVSHGWASEAE